jgi:hypothetical protein
MLPLPGHELLYIYAITGITSIISNKWHPTNKDISDDVTTFQDTSLNPPPPLKNEIVVDRLASIPVRSLHEALKKEASELESQIKQLHDSLDTLLRIQQRYVFFSFTENVTRTLEQHRYGT